MNRGRTVAVLVVLVLAGCQGPSTVSETVTPAPVPTASGAVSVDAERVAGAHRAALSNRSYTTTVALTVTYENGTTARLTDEFVVGPDGTYSYERRARGPYPQAVSNRSLWQNDSYEFTRTAENGSETVTSRSRSGFDDVSLSGFLGTLLGGFDRTAERTGGQTVVSGRQDGARDVPLPARLGLGSDARLNAVIRGDIVRTVTVTARAAYPDIDQSVDVRLRVTVRHVGESDPVRPAWATASNVTETG